jgi:hypothetical protein
MVEPILFWLILWGDNLRSSRSTSYGERGYTSPKFGTSSTILTQNFYDTYNYQSIPTYKSSIFDLEYKDFSTSGFGIQYSSAKGLLTGTAIAMLDGSSTLLTAMYYDDHGRVIQTRANNCLNGYDYEYYSYNFTGQPTKKCHVHKTSYIATPLTENYRYFYDHADRHPCVIN